MHAIILLHSNTDDSNTNNEWSSGQKTIRQNSKHIHVCLYIYIYIHMYIYTHIYTHLCMYIYIYTITVI